MLTNGVVAAAAIITGTDLSSQCMTDLEPPDKQADAQLALWCIAGTITTLQGHHKCLDIFFSTNMQGRPAMVDVTNLTAAKDRRKRDREVCCTPSTIVTGRVPIRDITNYAGFGATQAYSGTVFYGSWKCSSTVLISEGDAVSDGVRTRHKGKHLWMDHDQRQRVSCAMGRESPLLLPPTCRWSHAPNS
uniref:Uncharacterized protein n=2 Tax=Oryza barthii TaxID=65489 RepID=A0A0D3FTB2_9ORYZ